MHKVTYLYYSIDSTILDDSTIISDSFLKDSKMKKDLTSKVCKKNILAVRDSLEVLSGKWKLPIIITLQSGEHGFNELERTIDGITPKLLSKSLKDLEMNGFVKREVVPSSPVRLNYSLTDYSDSLNEIIEALQEWGLQHRKHIIEQ